MSSPKSKVIVCDFDGTLYHHGPVEKIVEFLQRHQDTHDIIIVTSRKYGNGVGQIQRVLYDARIRPAAIFPGVGHDNHVLKSAVLEKILRKKPVAIAIDNNPLVVLEYQALGVTATTPDGLEAAWQSELSSRELN